MMADEDEELYENLDSVSTRTSTRTVDSYDKVTINFGKPVINKVADQITDDLFGNVSFTSPIQDLELRLPPIPAPRPSKLNKSVIQTCDISEDDDVKSDSNSDNSLEQQQSQRVVQPPKVPPRNVILVPDISSLNHSYENVYTDILTNDNDDDEGLMDKLEDVPEAFLGARPRRKQHQKRPLKADTIDIRNTVSGWYDQASEEIERDLSLDLSVLEIEATPQPKPRGHDYEHIAIDDRKVSLIGGQIRLQAPTLLRDFDPILNSVEADVAAAEAAAAAINQDDELKQEVLEIQQKKSENIYVAVPFHPILHDDSKFEDEDDFIASPEPPSSPPPPPPPPDSEQEQTSLSYETVWLHELPKLFEDEIPPAVPPRLKKPPSFLIRNDDSAISSSTSSSSIDLTSSSSNNLPQRSFSALNLATKFASNIKRKMSDQQLVLSSRVSPPKLTSRRRSALLDINGLQRSQVKMRSGVLYVYSKSRRIFQPKWCMLNQGDFKYFNDKQTLAIPKEVVPVTSILSLKKHLLMLHIRSKFTLSTSTTCWPSTRS
jgi:hypothetical protein